jgi:hypothetical protein
LARLYALWTNGYYDHPNLDQRLPDATIQYRCIDDSGAVDANADGECTSVLWGHNPLILRPDARAQDGQMWSGLLTADEWQQLQLPGRILASLYGFWEHAVSDVLVQYLGYDLGEQVPTVRQALGQYVLDRLGDMRAALHAVLASQIYLQSAAFVPDGGTESAYRWTYGPLKQIDVEAWIDSVVHATGYKISQCDHRISEPDDLLRSGLNGLAVVRDSRWSLNQDNRVIGDYRDLARTLGGCPDNQTGGRFKTISILTTATQEAFVGQTCNATLLPDTGADVAALLPRGMPADRALSGAVAVEILNHQAQAFYGRSANAAEIEQAQTGAMQCAPKPCTAEAFARPLCYALLSSSEMLFY